MQLNLRDLLSNSLLGNKKMADGIGDMLLIFHQQHMERQTYKVGGQVESLGARQMNRFCYPFRSFENLV